jgi:hypothetical protein
MSYLNGQLVCDDTQAVKKRVGQKSLDATGNMLFEFYWQHT